MAPDDVAVQLDEECDNSRALSMTQASQISATQRREGRTRIRQVLLGLTDNQILTHIDNVESGAGLLKHFVLLISTYGNPSPSDTADSASACRARLSRTLVAIVKRLLEDENMAEHAATVCQAALDALDAVDTDTLEMIYQMIIHSLDSGAASAHALLPLLPACMALVHTRSAGTDAELLRHSRSNDSIRKLCAMHWPEGCTLALLSALRELPLEI
jgi:hypothetical protein